MSAGFLLKARDLVPVAFRSRGARTPGDSSRSISLIGISRPPCAPPVSHERVEQGLDLIASERPGRHLHRVISGPERRA